MSLNCARSAVSWPPSTALSLSSAALALVSLLRGAVAEVAR
jgi:hypothetical protein